MSAGIDLEHGEDEDWRKKGEEEELCRKTKKTRLIFTVRLLERTGIYMT